MIFIPDFYDGMFGKDLSLPSSAAASSAAISGKLLSAGRQFLS
jgi:hypothetical protein